MSDDRSTPPSPIPPSFDEQEEHTLNGTEQLPRPMRTWAESQSRRVRKVEKHFEKGGMVFELHSDWSAIVKSFNFWIRVGPILGAILVAGIGALMWIIHAAVAAQSPPPAPQPTPEQIARQVARELAKQKGTP